MFRGDDGLDELTTTTTSSVWVVHAGEVRTAVVDPRAHGFATGTTEALRGGDAQHNAGVVRRLLAGEPGPVRDAVLLNAGAALAVHDAPGAAGRRRRWRQGWTGPARPWTPARRRRRWTAGSPRPLAETAADRGNRSVPTCEYPSVDPGQSIGQAIGARLARGDESALEDAYATYSRSLLSFLRRYVGVDEAEDVLQRTFLDVWRSASRYDPAQRFSPGCSRWRTAGPWTPCEPGATRWSTSTR